MCVVEGDAGVKMEEDSGTASELLLGDTGDWIEFLLIPGEEVRRSRETPNKN